MLNLSCDYISCLINNLFCRNLIIFIYSIIFFLSNYFSLPGGPSFDAPVHFIQLDVGKAGVWAVSDSNYVYYKVGSYNNTKPDMTSSWQRVPGHYLNWVASGTDVILGITTENTVVYRSGINAANPVGNAWIDFGDRPLSQIYIHDSGSSQTVAGRDRDNEIYYSEFAFPPNGWNQLNQFKGTSMSLGQDKVWGLKHNSNQLSSYEWGASQVEFDDSGRDDFVGLSVAPDEDTIWVVDQHWNILRGSGADASSLQWNNITTTVLWSHVATGYAGRMWALDTSGYAYQWDGNSFKRDLGNTWYACNSHFVHYAVTSYKSSIWGVYRGGELVE